VSDYYTYVCEDRVKTVYSGVWNLWLASQMWVFWRRYLARLILS